MAIPIEINEDHILKALKEIKAMREIPVRRKSTKYFLHHDNFDYPPKYVISIANKFAKGEELDPDPRIFTTHMAQRYLKKKGFTDIRKIRK